MALDYHFTATIYAREERFNRAFDRQNFALDASYRVDPRLTLTLADAFSFSTDTNLIAAEGVATGRDRSWSNTVTPGAIWRYDRLTRLRAAGSYTLQRFERADLQESDVYRIEAAVDRDLTPRLQGTLAYQFGYFDIEEEERTTTHTPRVGVTYRFTPTLTGTIGGGPTFVVQNSGTRITPAATASLTRRFSWGSATAQYDRVVGTAGGLGGTTDNQAISALIQVTTLRKGLVVEVAPRYSTIDSGDDSIDVDGFTLGLRASYRLAAWITATAGYTFFHQRVDTTLLGRTGLPLAHDVDQNTVFVGVQFGYPIRFD